MSGPVDRRIDGSGASLPVAAGFHLQRQHKVVLVADLVQSVRLMESDELGVILRWQDFLAHVTATILPEAEGGFVKSLGDGLMAEFDSAPMAASAAMAMHAWFDRHQGDATAFRMQLRIGLHSTHFYEDRSDIYGAGINLAARIAALAPPGRTVVSAAVRDGLTDGIDGVLEDMGEWYLKHVEEPVHVYGIGPSGQVPVVWSLPEKTERVRTCIAVFPFVSHSAEPEQFAVGDLIAEGVIGRLGRTRELKVISHLSTAVFRERPRGLQEAQTYLGAHYVLSGSYAVHGKNVIVLAELADTKKNEIVWTERAAGAVLDLVQLHSELCDAISSGCHRALLDTEAKAALVQPLPTLQSYSLLLGGIGLMHRSAAQQFLKTREILEALIERHGQCALPRIWLAKWYVLCSTRGLVDNAKAQAQSALRETQRALEVEPDNALALAMQGFVYCHLMKDVERALQSCDAALELSSNESLAWLFKGMVHAFDGEGAVALPAGRKARELSPMDPLKYYYDSLMASIAISAGEYETAIGFAKDSLRVNATHLSSHRALILAQSLGGHLDEARKNMALLAARDPQFSIERFERGYPSRERVPRYLEQLKDALRAAGAPEH